MANVVSPATVRWGLAAQTSDPATIDTTMDTIIYAENDPNIGSGESLINYRGKSVNRYRSHEQSKRGKIVPSVGGLSFPFNAYSTPDFLYSLFQGVTEATNKKTFNVAGADFSSILSDDSISSESPHVLTVSRAATGSGIQDHAIIGAVVSSMTISGNSSGVIMCSVDLVGFNVDYDGAITTASEAFSTVGLVTPLVDFDGTTYTFTLFGQTPAVESFSLTMSNGAQATSYNGRTPRQITFAEFMDVSGEVVISSDRSGSTIPQLDGFIDAQAAGTDGILLIANSSDGAVNAAAEWYVKNNIRINGEIVEDETDTGHMATIPFIGVHDGTNDAAEVVVQTSSSRSW